MNTRGLLPNVRLFAYLLTVLAVSAFAYWGPALGRGVGGAAADGGVAAIGPTPTPQVTTADTPPPPAPFAGVQAQVSGTVLSPTLSYYFVSGATFTPDSGSTAYFRQVTGCMNQVPLNTAFTAPVHLPQGSQVRTITLYTYNDVVTSTISTGYFLINDGKGFDYGYTVSASSTSASGYQQNTSPDSNPTTIDNAKYAYTVAWYTSGASPSPNLSLCGIRVNYYAPLGASYLPLILK